MNIHFDLGPQASANDYTVSHGVWKLSEPKPQSSGNLAKTAGTIANAVAEVVKVLQKP